MKQMKSFRLSDEVLVLLYKMSGRMGWNNTQVLEQAIKFYYQRMFQKDYLDL